MCASWPLGSWLLEYIYALLSLGPFIFSIPGILSPVLGPSMDPGVRLGGTTAPYRAYIWEWSHSFLHSICGGFLFLSLGLYTGGHPHGGGSRCVNIGSTPYFPFYVPSFNRLFHLVSFVMTISPSIL